MNKEFFVNAEIEVVTFEVEDVITGSFDGDDHIFPGLHQEEGEEE